jgi:hypothetical protein
MSFFTKASLPHLANYCLRNTHTGFKACGSSGPVLHLELVFYYQAIYFTMGWHLQFPLTISGSQREGWNCLMLF